MNREDHSGEWFWSCTSIGERSLSTAPQYVAIYLWIICMCYCTSIHIIKHTQHSLFHSTLILFHLFKRDLHWSPSPTAWPILGDQKFNRVIKNIVQMLLYASRLWASTTSLGCLFQSFKRNKTKKNEVMPKCTHFKFFTFIYFFNGTKNPFLLPIGFF